MKLRALFLGTGTSHGVPMIGCRCPVCTSDDPRDHRNRPGLLLQSDGVSILVDTPPELRLACVRFGVECVDAVLFTHHHADHIFGLDDIRRFNARRDGPIRCYGAEETLVEIRSTFRYAFGTRHYGGGLPVIRLVPVDGRFRVGNLEFVTLPVWHGPTRVIGFRTGAFAYLTDVKVIPQETVPLLQGLDTLVLGVLRWREHPTHLSVPEALELLKVIHPRQTYFTHIAHDLGHEETERQLPAGVHLAYDGLALEVDI